MTNHDNIFDHTVSHKNFWKILDTFNQSVFDHILDQFYSSTYQTFSAAKTKGHFSSLENKIENLKSEKLYTWKPIKDDC